MQLARFSLQSMQWDGRRSDVSGRDPHHVVDARCYTLHSRGDVARPYLAFPGRVAHTDRMTNFDGEKVTAGTILRFLARDPKLRNKLVVLLVLSGLLGLVMGLVGLPAGVALIASAILMGLAIAFVMSRVFVEIRKR